MQNLNKGNIKTEKLDTKSFSCAKLSQLDLAFMGIWFQIILHNFHQVFYIPE